MSTVDNVPQSCYACCLVPHSFNSELTTLIDSAKAEDSPYQMSRAATSTDTTIYPPPSATEENGPPSSKRKRDDDGSALPARRNETVNARYPEVVYANKHILKLHETIKSECAQLSDSCVCNRLFFRIFF
jgi:proteasome activator subunit 3 (PA28 gamma)